MTWLLEIIEIGLLGLVLWKIRTPAPERITRTQAHARRQRCDQCAKPAMSVRTHFGAWRCKAHRAEGPHG